MKVEIKKVTNTETKKETYKQKLKMNKLKQSFKYFFI